MMTLKFSRNAKLTLASTVRRPVRPAVDNDFEIYSKRQIDTCFNRHTPSPPADDDFEIQLQRQSDTCLLGRRPVRPAACDDIQRIWQD